MGVWRNGAWAVALLSLVSPATVRAQAPAAPRLQGLSATDAQKVIGTLVAAQGKVRAGDKVYFELLSGAPASYDATLLPPRQAFLKMRFEKPDVIERVEPPNSLWQPYRLTYFGKKDDELMWEVEVVLGFDGYLERVQMLYKPPPPF
jgi:hypothetical protein